MSKYFEYGWITPNYKIFECDPFEHYSIIENEEFKSLFPKIKSKEDWDSWNYEKRQEEKHDWISQLGPDDHPAWHGFYTTTMWDMVQREGFMRFGTFKDNQDRMCIEIDGNHDRMTTSEWQSFIKNNFVVEIAYLRNPSSYTGKYKKIII